MDRCAQPSQDGRPWFLRFHGPKYMVLYSRWMTAREQAIRTERNWFLIYQGCDGGEFLRIKAMAHDVFTLFGDTIETYRMDDCYHQLYVCLAEVDRVRKTHGLYGVGLELGEFPRPLPMANTKTLSKKRAHADIQFRHSTMVQARVRRPRR